ncbi:hypothetical protein HYV86_03365 [Candidatus Woesearchaeota archaeon]|nr:hypothetical protein [Candidatus Woesearchaeota archaeon]
MQKYIPFLTLAAVLGCDDNHSRTEINTRFESEDIHTSLSYNTNSDEKAPSLLKYARWEKVVDDRTVEYNLNFIDFKEKELRQTSCDPKTRKLILEEGIENREGELTYVLLFQPTSDPTTQEYLGFGCRLTNPSYQGYPQDYLSITKGSILPEEKCLDLYLRSQGVDPATLAPAYGLQTNFAVRDLLEQRRLNLIGQMASIEEQLKAELNKPKPDAQ